MTILSSFDIVTRLSRVIGRAGYKIATADLEDLLLVLERLELQMRAIPVLLAGNSVIQVVREEVARR